jgi:hypothetical protein
MLFLTLLKDVYTYGVVFIEVNKLSLPISLSGMEVVSSTKGFEMMIGSLRHSEHNGTLLQRGGRPVTCGEFNEGTPSW